MSPLYAHFSFSLYSDLCCQIHFIFEVEMVPTTIQATYHHSLFEMLVLSDNVLWNFWHNFHHCEANDYCLGHTKIMRTPPAFIYICRTTGLSIHIPSHT